MEALQLAIWYTEAYDQEDMESAKIAGWKIILEALRNGEKVNIDNQ